jgi:hypothetical protein
MRVLHSYHASPGTPLTLMFDTDVATQRIMVPDTPRASRQALALAQASYTAEAAILVGALVQHLPGGLVDAIFGAFCAYKASVLKGSPLSEGHEVCGQSSVSS